MDTIPEISLSDLAGALRSPNPPRLLDVREPEELEISRLDPCVHIPLAELPYRLADLDPNADWVVVCRTGARSGRATMFLLGQGFERVRNMAGGMNGWAREIDETVQTY